MSTDNVVRDKSYAFALLVIKTYKQLRYSQKEFILANQLLKSGTSIGANIEEAIGAQSRKDFFAKLSISYKEALETRYWIKLLRDSSYLSKEQADELYHSVEELLRILGSIRKTILNS